MYEEALLVVGGANPYNISLRAILST